MQYLKRCERRQLLKFWLNGLKILWQGPPASLPITLHISGHNVKIGQRYSHFLALFLPGYNIASFLQHRCFIITLEF
jgi:hypothetical protein